MREMFECEYCGEIFYDKKSCFEHEIDVHGGADRYKKMIFDILNRLNEKYNENKSIDDKKLDLQIIKSECDGFSYIQIQVSFYIEDYLIEGYASDETIESRIEYEMNQYFLENIKTIEGVLEYEGWCGGHGNDDYLINGIYLKDLLLNKEGKKIKIEILD